MTDKPTTYRIPTEHFARARADIERRRADLDAELAQLDACEATVAGIAERYSEGTVAPALKTPKAPRSNTGRPYKRTEDARIAAAERGELEKLAQDLGRPYSGVLKRHEILGKKRGRAQAVAPPPSADLASDKKEEAQPTVKPPPPETPASDPAPIVEATVASKPAPVAAVRRRPAPTPGIPVDGIIDSGIGRQRILDPVAFSSKHTE